MKLKRIKLLTKNFYKFIIIFCYIQKVWSTPKLPNKDINSDRLWHERYNRGSHISTTPPATSNIAQTYKLKNIHEAAHAFNPVNNFHLRHEHHKKYHHLNTYTTSTTIRPSSFRRHWYNYHSSPLLTYSNQSKLRNDFSGNTFNTRPAIHPTIGVRSTMATTISATKAPFHSPTSRLLSVHKNDEHFRKSIKTERQLPFTDETRTPTLLTDVESRRFKQNGFDEVEHENENWNGNSNNFKEKFYENDMFTNGDRVQQYLKRLADNKADVIIDDRIENGRGIDESVNRDLKSRNLVDYSNRQTLDGDQDMDIEDNDDDEDEDDYDDLYLDDESALNETDSTGSLTEEKWRNYGTVEAVEKSMRQNRKSIQQMAAHNATAHISRIYAEALCKFPRPKIVPIVAEPSKTYAPHCTILHRCGDDTGCCQTDALTCVPKRTTTVDLYFYVTTMGKRMPTVESLTFINHTECHCINRGERHDHRNRGHNPSGTRTTGNGGYGSYSLTGGARNRNQIHCTCVKYFIEFIERVDDNDGDEGSNSDSETHRRCRCDCVAGNSTCESYKKGIEGFSIDDRRCIVDNRCTLPTCEYGPYNKKTGRCPKLEDKLSSARLFFD